MIDYTLDHIVREQSDVTTIDFEDPVKLPGFLSYSQMSTFNKCPQAWHYKYLRHLDADETHPPVQAHFGSWWHALRATDSIVRGRDAGTLKYVQDHVETVDGGPTLDTGGASSSGVLMLARSWWDGQSEDYRAEFVGKLGAPLPDRLDMLNTSYVLQWMESREHEQPVAVEVPVTLPMRTSSGTTFRFTGFIDEIYRDAEHGFLVVRDHKTNSSLSQFSNDKDILESQLQLYAWAAQKTLDLGGRIRATAYDRVRSVAPKLPSVTKSGTLSKAVTDYDLRTYQDWCREGVPFDGTKKDGSGAGVYESDPKVVEKLSAPDEVGRWFKRTLSPLNARVVRMHVATLADVADELPDELERVNVRHEARRRMSTGNCRYCDFFQLCRAQVIGGPDGGFQPADFGLHAGSGTDK